MTRSGSGSHLIDALADAAGDEVIERVSPAPSFTGAVVVERLLAQLERLEEPLVLVIDDLHELDSEDALGWLEMLLTRLPTRLRVVLATREEPALGLHRLRLAGELTELRGPDLRFSLDESRALLRAGGITLSDIGIGALHERTEGWPAGLRLAAISLIAHPDPERFVSEFSGSERTVAGYLLAEVLERQPPEVRDLLVRTSILERVSGPLADVLTAIRLSRGARQQQPTYCYHEGVAGGDGGRVARCQVDQFGVVARAPDQPWPGRLAEGNPELQGRTHAHQRLVKVVNRLDEVRLADHDVHVVGLVDGHHVPGQRRLGHAPMVPPPVSAIERVLDEPAGVKMVGTARLGVFAARLGTARERVRGVA